jgi:hypothetical protein
VRKSFPKLLDTTLLTEGGIQQQGIKGSKTTTMNEPPWLAVTVQHK